MLPLLASLVVGASPGPTWTLFPEGTTELREDVKNNLTGEQRRVTTRVTRTGTRVSVVMESSESRSDVGGIGVVVTPGGGPDSSKPTDGLSCATVGCPDNQRIRRIVREHLAHVKFCYEKLLLGMPTLTARVVMKWHVTGDGSVDASEVVSSTAPTAELGSCLADRVRSWRFPGAKRAEGFSVSYPFVFGLPEPRAVRAETSALTEAATSPDGERFDFRCVRKRMRVHSPDMEFVMRRNQECDGGFVDVRSRNSKNVLVLVCKVDPTDANAPPLTFVPGKVLERVFEDNDCTLAEGFRFIDST